MMELLAKTVIGICVIAFFILIAFFGRLPALRHTPIAWLYRIIWVAFPKAVFSLDQRLTGGRLTSSVGRFFNYMLYDKHPTILIFFILLLTIGEFLYLPGAWPRLSLFNQIFGFISIVLPYYYLYRAAYSDPGIITPSNHGKNMSHYPYDFTLFHPGQTCKTCLLLKPARSKHCSVCKRCVARMDHHCVFINNCVGYGNQHYFLLLLLTTAWLTLYGAILGFAIVRETAVLKSGNDNFRLWKASNMPWNHYFLLLMVGIQDDVGLGSVTLLTAMTTPMVWGLLGYHVYLVWCGTTTNESMKWSDWKIEMEEGCAFKRSLNPEPPLSRVRDTAAEPVWTRWPVEALQILVRTDDGHPPHKESPYGFGEWERVWHLKDVENLYDIGFWDNLTDIMVPKYSFRAEGKGQFDVEGGRGMGRRGKNRSVDGRDIRRAEKERARRSKKPNVPAVSGIVNAAM